MYLYVYPENGWMLEKEQLSVKKEFMKKKIFWSISHLLKNQYIGALLMDTLCMITTVWVNS